MQIEFRSVSHREGKDVSHKEDGRLGINFKVSRALSHPEQKSECHWKSYTNDQEGGDTEKENHRISL